jgi:hypothetical protein
MGKEAEVWNSKDDGNFMNQVLEQEEATLL